MVKLASMQAKSNEATAELASGELKLDWAPPRIHTWCAQVDDVQEWLLEGLLPADSAILVSGKAKRAYKSWLAFQIAICIASGKTMGPFVPCNVSGLPVLILEAEGGRAQTRHRWEWLANGSGIRLMDIPVYFSHRENILLDDAGWTYKIKRFIAHVRPGLVIVDPLAMFSRGDENKVADVARVMRSLAEFREQGASVIFLHHLAKTQKDWNRDPDEEIRGSSAIAGFYDQHWALRQRRDNQKHNDLTIRSKDDEEKFYEIRWFIDKALAKASFTMAEADEEKATSNLREDLLLQMLANIEYSQRRISEILGDPPTSEIEALIADLLQEEKLVKCGRGFMLKE